MCIFTGNIDYVSSTRIFARLSQGKQAVIYDMYLSTQVETAMVLPIPSIREQEAGVVEFVDLSEYLDFFDDVDNLFPKEKSIRLDAVAAGALDLCEVVEVGMYEASYIPTAKDFDRLDPRFRLDPSFLDALPQYKEYGFVVFQLRPGASKVHPMAFWFKTTKAQEVFFPTVHIHHGQVEEFDMFSHSLYCQNDVSGLPGLILPSEINDTDLQKKIARKALGLVDPSENIYKLKMDGRLENKDTWLSIPSL